MPFADLIYNSDMAKKCDCHKPPMPPKADCCCPPPPLPPDYPPYPYPFPPYFPSTPEPEVPIKKTSIEAQICKLSKKAAAINRMIVNFEEKNKDAIIRIGDASYNFGSYTITKEDEDEPVVTEYGEAILGMLKTELNLIKAKIAELATELGEETTGATTFSAEVEKTIWNI